MKTLVKWTVEDYHRLIETGLLGSRNIELLQGELIEMPPEGPFHSYITEGIADYFRGTLQGKALVREAHPITLSNSEPQPDLAIVQLPRNLYRQRHPYPEDIFWLIEISQSTLAYDLAEKKQTYAQAGIPEYWVLDIKKQQVYVFRNPNENDYTLKFVVTEGSLSSLAFPELEISVNLLLGD